MEQTPIASAAELEALMPPQRQRTEPVIVHQDPYTNLAPAGWVLDPADPDRFLLYVGRFRGNHSIGADVAVYCGECRDPYSLRFEGVVLAPGESGSEDELGVRFGSVVQSGGDVYHYYVGNRPDSRAQVVMLAVSEDGRRFTKQGTIVTPDGVHEHYFTDPTVVIIDGTWFMYVTGKSAEKLPNLGIVVYASDDGVAWRRTGVTAVPTGGPEDCDAKYIEGCGVCRLGDDVVALYTCCSGADVWSVGMAWGADPLATFSKAAPNPVFERSSAGWDSGGVAVPLLVRYPSGRSVLYYQGSVQEQPADTWDIGAVEAAAPPSDG